MKQAAARSYKNKHQQNTPMEHLNYSNSPASIGDFTWRLADFPDFNSNTNLP
jgi:hypothetical protein